MRCSSESGVVLFQSCLVPSSLRLRQLSFILVAVIWNALWPQIAAAQINLTKTIVENALHGPQSTNRPDAYMQFASACVFVKDPGLKSAIQTNYSIRLGDLLLGEDQTGRRLKTVIGLNEAAYIVEILTKWHISGITECAGNCPDYPLMRFLNSGIALRVIGTYLALPTVPKSAVTTLPMDHQLDLFATNIFNYFTELAMDAVTGTGYDPVREKAQDTLVELAAHLFRDWQPSSAAGWNQRVTQLMTGSGIEIVDKDAPIAQLRTIMARGAMTESQVTKSTMGGNPLYIAGFIDAVVNRTRLYGAIDHKTQQPLSNFGQQLEEQYLRSIWRAFVGSESHPGLFALALNETDPKHRFSDPVQAACLRALSWVSSDESSRFANSALGQEIRKSAQTSWKKHVLGYSPIESMPIADRLTKLTDADIDNNRVYGAGPEMRAAVIRLLRELSVSRNPEIKTPAIKARLAILQEPTSVLFRILTFSNQMDAAAAFEELAIVAFGSLRQEYWLRPLTDNTAELTETNRQLNASKAARVAIDTEIASVLNRIRSNQARFGTLQRHRDPNLSERQEYSEAQASLRRSRQKLEIMYAAERERFGWLKQLAREILQDNSEYRHHLRNQQRTGLIADQDPIYGNEPLLRSIRSLVETLIVDNSILTKITSAENERAIAAYIDTLLKLATSDLLIEDDRITTSRRPPSPHTVDPRHAGQVLSARKGILYVHPDYYRAHCAIALQLAFLETRSVEIQAAAQRETRIDSDLSLKPQAVAPASASENELKTVSERIVHVARGFREFIRQFLTHGSHAIRTTLTTTSTESGETDTSSKSHLSWNSLLGNSDSEGKQSFLGTVDSEQAAATLAALDRSRSLRNVSLEEASSPISHVERWQSNLRQMKKTIQTLASERWFVQRNQEFNRTIVRHRNRHLHSLAYHYLLTLMNTSLFTDIGVFPEVTDLLRYYSARHILDLINLLSEPGHFSGLEPTTRLNLHEALSAAKEAAKGDTGHGREVPRYERPFWTRRTVHQQTSREQCISSAMQFTTLVDLATQNTDSILEKSEQAPERPVQGGRASPSRQTPRKRPAINPIGLRELRGLRQKFHQMDGNALISFAQQRVAAIQNAETSNQPTQAKELAALLIWLENGERMVADTVLRTICDHIHNQILRDTSAVLTASRRARNEKGKILSKLRGLVRDISNSQEPLFHQSTIRATELPNNQYVTAETLLEYRQALETYGNRHKLNIQIHVVEAATHPYFQSTTTARLSGSAEPVPTHAATTFRGQTVQIYLPAEAVSVNGVSTYELYEELLHIAQRTYVNKLLGKGTFERVIGEAAKGNHQARAVIQQIHTVIEEPCSRLATDIGKNFLHAIELIEAMESLFVNPRLIQACTPFATREYPIRSASTPSQLNNAYLDRHPITTTRTKPTTALFSSKQLKAMESLNRSSDRAAACLEILDRLSGIPVKNAPEYGVPYRENLAALETLSRDLATRDRALFTTKLAGLSKELWGSNSTNLFRSQVSEGGKFALALLLAQLLEVSGDMSAQGFIEFLGTLPSESVKLLVFGFGASLGTAAYDLRSIVQLKLAKDKKLARLIESRSLERMKVHAGQPGAALRNQIAVVTRIQCGFVAGVLFKTPCFRRLWPTLLARKCYGNRLLFWRSNRGEINYSGRCPGGLSRSPVRQIRLVRI